MQRYARGTDVYKFTGNNFPAEKPWPCPYLGSETGWASKMGCQALESLECPCLDLSGVDVRVAYSGFHMKVAVPNEVPPTPWAEGG